MVRIHPPQQMRHRYSSGKLWKWIHGTGTVVWTVLFIPGMTVWRDSVAFVVFVSLYAIVLSHIVGYVAALSARNTERDD